MTVQQRGDIERFLHPTGVAIIGGIVRTASEEATRARYDALYGAGTWHLVSPRGGAVGTIAIHTALADVPVALDLAVITVPPAACASVVEECGRAGVEFAVVFSSGFSEVGPEGAELERELADAGRRHGVRLFGPNTNTNAFEAQPEVSGYRYGKIGLVTQSGHNGRPVVEGASLGIAFSRQVPCGNEVDFDVCDFIEYFAYDDDTAVVAGYIEGFRDIGRLRRALEACHAQGKPVVLLKIGSTRAGSRMAASHTGHLTGSDAIIDGLFAQYDVVRVRDLDELLETAALLAKLPHTTGPNVALYSISGGSGTLMAEQAELAGLPIPSLSTSTQQAVHELLPGYLTVSNPVDNGGTFVTSRPAAERTRVLEIVMADDAVDVLVVGVTGAMTAMSLPVCEDLLALAESGTTKPIVVTWNSPKTDEPGYDLLLQSQLPVFRSFRNCFGALRRFDDWRAGLDEVRSRPAPEPLAPDVTRLVDGLDGGVLGAEPSRTLLAAAGIPYVHETLASSSSEAAAAAAAIGGPVAMKLSSPDIPHKTDAGLVRLGVTPNEVADTYAELIAVAHAVAPHAVIDGVVVQQMVEDGVEVIVGITTDPVVGPSLLVGLGGVFTEVLADAAVRPLPVDAGDIRAMLSSLRGFPLLDGARGRPPCDLDAVVDIGLGVARLAATLGPRLVELDLNPVVVGEKGAVALDALIALTDRAVSGGSNDQPTNKEHTP